MRRGLWLFITALGAAAVTAAAQDPHDPPHNFFQSRVDLIGVAASVVNQEGGLVTGLSRDAFEVYEDGARQTITQFTSERVPVSVAVLLDVSDSMFGQRLTDAR